MKFALQQLLVVCIFLMNVTASRASTAEEMNWVAVSPNKRGFILLPSGQSFRPWGFNYDRDDAGRLLEDYWQSEWEAVEADFAEMKQMGANVVRIHLQLGKFMDSAETPNQEALNLLTRLLLVAEQNRIYLNVTGLGCYHKKDVPAWFDALNETDRWNVQARFWKAIAKTCANSPAVFCYDLMNEPVSPAHPRQAGDWLGPDFYGKHYVQFISLTPDNRARPEIAAQWIKVLTTAIREVDQRHLITVGLVDWSLDRPGLTSGFVPSKIEKHLDFISVHLYPHKGKVGEALETLAGFDVGKPIVIEETFPLSCTFEEFVQFIEQSEKHASGWFGFYWGKPRDELRRSSKLADQLLLAWLDYFVSKSQKSP